MKKLLPVLLFAITWNAMYAQNYGDIGNVTDIDGNVYETVYLQDNTWWMLENLQVKKKPDGSAATFVFPFNGTDNDPDMVAQGAGLLYDRDMLLGWPHTLRAQGLCPDGWHVPTRDELENLTRKLGGTPSHWGGDGWLPLVTALNLGATRGGKWDPSGNFRDPGMTGWGVYLSTSTSAWGNEVLAFMVAIAADGSTGGITQDPKTVAGNCRCAKDRDITMSIKDLTDLGLTVVLSDSIITNIAQVKVLNVTDASDKWEVDLTSVVLSENKHEISINAYLEVTQGEKYEVRFMDTQVTTLPLSGYNIIQLNTSAREYIGQSIRVYPNPANEMLFVEAATVSSVRIYNALGSMVYENNGVSLNREQVDVSSLNNGIYFIRVYDREGQSVTRKFVKN